MYAESDDAIDIHSSCQTLVQLIASGLMLFADSFVNCVTISGRQEKHTQGTRNFLFKVLVV